MAQETLIYEARTSVEQIEETTGLAKTTKLGEAVY